MDHGVCKLLALDFKPRSHMGRDTLETSWVMCFICVSYVCKHKGHQTLQIFLRLQSPVQQGEAQTLPQGSRNDSIYKSRTQPCQENSAKYTTTINGWPEELVVLQRHVRYMGQLRLKATQLMLQAQEHAVSYINLNVHHSPQINTNTKKKILHHPWDRYKSPLQRCSEGIHCISSATTRVLKVTNSWPSE